jgi:hypothetical protein
MRKKEVEMATAAAEGVPMNSQNRLDQDQVPRERLIQKRFEVKSNSSYQNTGVSCPAYASGQAPRNYNNQEAPRCLILVMKSNIKMCVSLEVKKIKA